MRIFEIPEGSKTSKGRAIQNLLNIESDDKVLAYIPVLNLKDEEYINGNNVILCTKQGMIKKTTLEAYSRPRTNGINAITIKDNDELLEARLTNGENEIVMALKSGKAIRFPEQKVRAVGRTAQGVKGVTLQSPKDEVIGMICVTSGDESDILVVAEKGYGKRSAIADYRVTNRGGKGVKTINITDKTGELIAIKNVTDEDDVMIINKSGVAIRLQLSDLRTMGRNTQGVRLINLKGNDEIAAVAKVIRQDEEDEVELDENGDPIVPEPTSEDGESESEEDDSPENNSAE
jgi:DNA gyrase subunit A